jgi:hypothetical protein
MGLIKNSVEQGQQAIQSMIKAKKPPKNEVIDVAIIGAITAKNALVTEEVLNPDTLTLPTEEPLFKEKIKADYRCLVIITLPVKEIIATA